MKLVIVVPLIVTNGVLLSIASKNDHDAAWSRLEELGIAEYFLHPQISWMPKSGGVKTIAQRLNIGIDTFAFVDDNPFELEEVKSVLPMVETVHVDDLTDIVNRPRYKGSSSVEAKNRRQKLKPSS